MNIMPKYKITLTQFLSAVITFSILLIISSSTVFAATNSTTVSLTLSCNDANSAPANSWVSGCDKMRFSNDSFVTASDPDSSPKWSIWQAFATTKSWSITSGDGSKTVFVQYKDRVGNKSAIFQKSVVLDTTLPTTSITAPVSGSTQSLDFTVSITDSDTGSGLKTCFYKIDSGSAKTRTCNSDTPAITVGASATDCAFGNTCTITAYSQDNAGNNSTQTSRSFTVSAPVSAPQAPVVSSTDGASAGTCPTNGDCRANVTVTALTTAQSGDGLTIKSYTAKVYLQDSTATTISGTLTCPDTGCPAGANQISILGGLANATGYKFKVYATNKASLDGPESANFTNTINTPPANTAPEVPTGLTATRADSNATITWTAPANGGSAITNYRFVFSAPAGISPVEIVAGTCTTAGSSTGCSTSLSALLSPGVTITNGTTYTFTIAAKNNQGTGAASSATSVIPASAPSLPTLSSASAGDTTATITWITPANFNGSSVSSYTVRVYTRSATTYTRVGSDAAGPVGTVNCDSSTTNPCSTVSRSINTIVNGLQNGTAYYFTVVVSSNPGPVESAYSTFSAIPVAPPAPPPAVTTGNATSITANSATLNGTVNPNGGSTNADFYYATSPPPSGSNCLAMVGSQATAFKNAGSGTLAVSFNDSVPGLFGNTPYYFCINAQNDGGGVVGGVNSFTTAPGKPTGVSAAAGYGAAIVSWTAPSGTATITGYTVTSSPGNVVATVDGSTTSTSIWPLTNGTGYTFTVYATNATGLGTVSDPSLAVTPQNPPTLSASVSGAYNVNLSWTSVTGATDYNIYWCRGDNCTDFTSDGLSKTSSNTLTVCGGTQKYKIRVFNASGQSGFSNVASVITSPCPVTTLTGSAVSSSQIDLTWTGTIGGDNYRIYICGGSGCTDFVSFDQTSNTTYSHTGRQCGTTYRYRVKAYNSNGESNPSTGNTTGGITPACPASAPGVPTLTAATPTGDSSGITLSWNAPSATGGTGVTISDYTITYYKNTEGSTGTLTINNVSCCTKTINLDSSQAENGYTFSVAARNSANLTGSVASTYLPTIPTNLQATGVTDRAITVSYNASTGLATPDYGSSICEGSTCTPPRKPVGNTSALTQTIGALLSCTTYRIGVGALNYYIGWSNISNVVTATTTGCATAPGVPTSLATTTGSQIFSLTWTAPASGGSTIIDYTVTYQPAGSTVTTATGQPCCGYNSPFTLTNGTQYTVTVAARNAVGTGTAASTTVTPADAPQAPTNVSATPGNAQATVSWTAPTSNGGSTITSYTVTSSPGNKTGSATCPAAGCSVAALTATVLDLTNGTPYSFTVKATNAAGTGPASAPSVTVTPATVPGAPTGISAATAGSNQAAITFAAPTSNGGAAITSYTITSFPVTAAYTAVSDGTMIYGGLANGTSYTFTVTATNAVGTGLPTPASNAVTPVDVLPGAPTGISATPGNAQATVSWTAPTSNGGSTITSYTVTSSPGDITATSASSPATVTGLTNGTSYTFTVTATNAVGTGSASAASNSVIPLAPIIDQPADESCDPNDPGSGCEPSR